MVLHYHVLFLRVGPAAHAHSPGRDACTKFSGGMGVHREDIRFTNLRPGPSSHGKRRPFNQTCVTILAVLALNGLSLPWAGRSPRTVCWNDRLAWHFEDGNDDHTISK